MWSGLCLDSMFRAATRPGQERDGRESAPLAGQGTQEAGWLKGSGEAWEEGGTGTKPGPWRRAGRECSPGLSRVSLHHTWRDPAQPRSGTAGAGGPSPVPRPPALEPRLPPRGSMTAECPIRTSPQPGAGSGPNQTRALLFLWDPQATLFSLGWDGLPPVGPPLPHSQSLAGKRGGYRGLGRSASDRWAWICHQPEPQERRPRPQQQRQTGRWSA